MRKLLQISLLGAIAVATSAFSSIEPLDRAGVAKLCTDNDGKLVKKIDKDDEGKIISTKIICNIKLDIGGTKKEVALFDYDKDIQFERWLVVKLNSSKCLGNGTKIRLIASDMEPVPNYAGTMPMLTSKQNDEYKEAVYKKCKLDLSYKMYEKEKDAFNNVDVEEK